MDAIDKFDQTCKRSCNYRLLSINRNTYLQLNIEGRQCEVRFEIRHWHISGLCIISSASLTRLIGVYQRSTFVGSVWSFVFSSPPQRPMTSDFEEFSIPDVIHYIYFPILILEKEPIFSLLNVQCQTRELLVPFYNVFGMTRSWTGD